MSDLERPGSDDCEHIFDDTGNVSFDELLMILLD